MNPKPLTAAQVAAIDRLVAARRLTRVVIDLARSERFLVQAQDALAELPNITSNRASPHPD